jgi:hypothetical protein
MARRSRPSLKSRSKSNPWARTWMTLGIVSICAVIGGLLFYGAFYSKKIVLDKVSGCPINGPVSKTVILIDQTDTFTHVQVVDIQNQFEAYKESIPRYGELVIYTIRSESSVSPTPIIRACNPGNEEDVNQLIESSIRIAQKWRDLFDEPIREVMKDVLQPMSSKTSPIIETIQAVSVYEFGSKKMDNRDKNLIIVSDLLQHSNALSHYSRKYNINSFIESQSYKKLSADLRDVDVDLLYLRRNTRKANQNSEHRNFWVRLIQEQGGSVRKIYSVSG